jgi:fibronectin type 3 domain-containing protein
LENANGCDSIVSLSLVVKNPPLQQEICMVSVDDNNHNEVVWKRNEDVAAYNIYKESSQSGQYDLVATIDYDSANTWTDMESNARIRSYGYKVSGVDSCGNESPISSNHKTMHLTINAGQNNSWNLIWTPYEGTSYQTYNIYRATGYYGSFGAMELIGTMPSTNTSYSDFTAPAGAYVYYVVEIMLNEPCTLSKSLASIRSNVATNNPNALADIETGNTLVIYPNPASNKITIDCNDKINNIEIVDVLGKIIYQTKDTTIDVSAFAKGNYFVKVYTEKGVMARKVVVE